MGGEEACSAPLRGGAITLAKERFYADLLRLLGERAVRIAGVVAIH